MRKECKARFGEEGQPPQKLDLRTHRFSSLFPIQVVQAFGGAFCPRRFWRKLMLGGKKHQASAFFFGRGLPYGHGSKLIQKDGRF